MTRPPKEQESDFLARWSRRKSHARDAPEEQPEPPAKAPPPADAPARTEAEVLEELGLPDPETLGPGSDFRAFMAEAVPDFIRRKALRRLWTSNPALANVDMLVEYGEDYTDKATVVANLQSAYKAGRGYLDRLAEKETPEEDTESPPESPGATATADGADDDEGESERTASAPDEPVEASASAPPEDEADPAAPSPPDAREGTQSATAAPRRRRMRFDFDQG